MSRAARAAPPALAAALAALAVLGAVRPPAATPAPSRAGEPPSASALREPDAVERAAWRVCRRSVAVALWREYGSGEPARPPDRTGAVRAFAASVAPPGTPAFKSAFRGCDLALHE